MSGRFWLFIYGVLSVTASYDGLAIQNDENEVKTDNTELLATIKTVTNVVNRSRPNVKSTEAKIQTDFQRPAELIRSLNENDVMVEKDTRPYITSDSNHLPANTVLISKDMFNELNNAGSLVTHDIKREQQFKSKISLNEKKVNDEYVLAKIISCSREDKKATEILFDGSVSQKKTKYIPSTEKRDINEYLTDYNTKFELTKPNKAKKYGFGFVSINKNANNLSTTKNDRYEKKSEFKKNTLNNATTTDKIIIPDFIINNIAKYMNMKLTSSRSLFEKGLPEKFMKRYNKLSPMKSKQSKNSYYIRQFNKDNDFVVDLRKDKLHETFNFTNKVKGNNKRVKRNVNPMLSKSAEYNKDPVFIGDKEYNYDWEKIDVHKMLEEETVKVDTNSTTTKTRVPLFPRRMLAVAPTQRILRTQIDSSATTKDIKQAYFSRLNANVPNRSLNSKHRGLMMHKYKPMGIFPRHKHMRLAPSPGNNPAVIESEETFNIRVRSRLNIPNMPMLRMTTDNTRSFIKSLDLPQKDFKPDLANPNSLIESGRRSMKTNITFQSIPEHKLKELFEDPLLSDFESAIGTKQPSEESTHWGLFY